MGSGFYESTAVAGQPPSVPLAIRDSLREAGLLTRGAEIDLFVNPLGCKAIAESVESIIAEGITVRPAGCPAVVYGEDSARTLHAKFLFGANSREGSPQCSRPWVYLGSGNLTGPGFVESADAGGGNLEAGVVFATPHLLWQAKRGAEKRAVISSLLPVQREYSFTQSAELTQGEGFPERPDETLAGPVAWLQWQTRGADGELVAPEPAQVEYDVLDSDRTTPKRTRTARTAMMLAISRAPRTNMLPILRSAPTPFAR